MFYDSFILTKQGPLAKIWLAAHNNMKKLTKNVIQQTSISKSSKGIIESTIPISLRTSGHLLLGVVKIYSRKVKYVLSECNDAHTKMKLQSVSNSRVDLPERSNVATFAHITLPDNVENVEMMITDLDVEDVENKQIQQRMRRLLMRPANNQDSMNQWEVESTQSDGLSFIQGGSLLTPSQEKFNDRVSEVSTKSTEKALFATQTDIPETIDFEKMMGTMDEDDGVPGRTSSIDGRISEFPEDFGDIDIPGGDEIVLEPPKPQEIVQKKRTGKKRSRPAHWDDPVEISRNDFRKQMNDTTDIIRRKKKAPRTRYEVDILDKTEINIDYMFQNALSCELPEDVKKLYTNGLKVIGSNNNINEGFSGDIDNQKRAVETNDIMDVDIQEGEEIVIPEVGDLDEDLTDFESTQIQSDKIRRITTHEIGNFTEDFESSVNDELAPQTEEEVENYKQINKKLKNIGYTKRTMEFLAKVKPHFDTDEDEISLTSVIGDKSRKTAAQAFYQILELSNKNLIKPYQERPYGEILLSKKPKLQNILN